jgi:hypothetical protein
MAKTTKKAQSKADFVRGLSSTMPAAAVIERGKAAGIRLSKNYIYRVRTWANAAAKSKARKADGTSAADGTSPAPPERGRNQRPRRGQHQSERELTAGKGGAAQESAGSKAAWVRAHPNLSPKEVVEKAAAAGIKFGVHYVYNVRRHQKSGAGTKRREARALVDRKGAAVPRPITAASTAESLLKALAAEIGLGQALEILAGERARVRAVIGG